MWRSEGAHPPRSSQGRLLEEVAFLPGKDRQEGTVGTETLRKKDHTENQCFLLLSPHKLKTTVRGSEEAGFPQSCSDVLRPKTVMDFQGGLTMASGFGPLQPILKEGGDRTQAVRGPQGLGQ